MAAGPNAKPRPREAALGSGARRATRIQPGLLVVPFLVGAGLTMAIVAGSGNAVTAGWLLVAILVGTMAAALTLVLTLGSHRPAHVANALNAAPLKPHQEAMGGDPLAHIHAVEQQARRHRRPCTNCGTPVKSSADRCPNCDHRQLFSCKGCRTQVRLDWTNCPECGRSLPGA